MKKIATVLAELAITTFTLGLALIAIIGVWQCGITVASIFEGPPSIPTLAHIEPLPEQIGSYSVDAEPVTGLIDFSASVGYAEKVEAGQRFIDDRR